MKTFQKTFIYLICLFVLNAAIKGSEPYPVDSAMLKERLEWFQDLKFGLLGGLGIWSVRDGQGPWVLSNPSSLRVDDQVEFDYEAFRESYWNCIKVYYPYNFDENEWISIVKEAGARYFMPHIKHHDGFCTWDTKYSDFKITSPDCPYSKHPNPDITARLYDACRKAGLGIAVYFSYSDWNCPYYWKPGVKMSDDTRINRHFNYDLEEEPERLEKFNEFLHGQIDELTGNYGKVDILWLDGGWDKRHMDVNGMVEIAYKNQPELIIVSRGGNIYEDYETPENRVPEEPLGVPWETVMGMGSRSAKQLVHILVDIVCKGGNFMLGGYWPGKDGRWEESVVARLMEIGDWLEVNGEAIYETRMYSMTNFREGNICYTKKGKYVYAIYIDERRDVDEISSLGNVLDIKHVKPLPDSKIHMLGVEESLEWEATSDGVKVMIPKSIILSPPSKFAYSFRIEVSE
ncbi:alpha-L-fucosidase [Bacteroidota bacterium]